MFIANSSGADLGPLPDKDGNVFALSFDDQFARSSNQLVFGSGKLSDHIESGLDFVERCLNSPPPQKQNQSTDRDLLDDLQRLNILGSAYEFGEFIFLRALWLGWQLVEDKSSWLFVPADIDRERFWEASLRRASNRLIENQVLISDIWATAPAALRSWPRDSGGVPHFIIREKKDVILLDFQQRRNPSSPPSFLVNDFIVRSDYYTLLLDEPMPNLNDKCLRDVLDLFFTLSLVSDEIVNRLPVDGAAIELDDLNRFCPAIQHKSLVEAFSQATDLRTQDIKAILKALTWSAGKSLWFHPLVRTGSKMGPVYYLALLPLQAPNIHWCIEYWLTEFGLTLERRGELFEKQVVDGLNKSVYRRWAPQQIKVAGPLKLKSGDRSSQEQIDLLVLIDNLLIVGEAKCQKYPMTPVETHKYLETLKDGASQASRKTSWALDNLDVIANALGVNQTQFAGQVQPIVISNHPLGVGMVFDGVPVLDLSLVSNYFLKPFLSEMQLGSEGLKFHRASSKFYESLREMADYFPDYVIDPPFLRVYLNSLEPDLRPLSVSKNGKPLQMLQFLVNPDNLPKVRSV